MDVQEVIAVAGIVVSVAAPFLSAYLVLKISWSQGTSVEFKKEHAALMQNMDDSRKQIANLRRNNATLLRIISELPGADLARIVKRMEGWTDDE